LSLLSLLIIKLSRHDFSSPPSPLRSCSFVSFFLLRLSDGLLGDCEENFLHLAFLLFYCWNPIENFVDFVLSGSETVMTFYYNASGVFFLMSVCEYSSVKYDMRPVFSYCCLVGLVTSGPVKLVLEGKFNFDPLCIISTPT